MTDRCDRTTTRRVFRLASLHPAAMSLVAVAGVLAPMNAGGGLPGGVAAMAAPEPEPVPRRWQLTVRMGDLRAVTVDVPEKGPQVYFVLTYTVTNNSGEDVYFAPSFELYADDGQILRSGRDVPREAVDACIAQSRIDGILSEIKIQGMLMQGPEHAKDGIVLWPAANLSVDEVVVFAEGFSGETRTVLRPDNGEKVVLRKTYMMRHEVSGEIDPKAGRPLMRTAERWILR